MKKTCPQTATITDTTRQTVENNRVISEQSEAGQRALASWGRRLQGWVGATRAEVLGGDALMGLGRLASLAGGPQEALACGLALGRPATAAVRWADRLRERRPSPCDQPSPLLPSLCTHVWSMGSNKLSENKQRWRFNIFKMCFPH